MEPVAPLTINKPLTHDNMKFRYKILGRILIAVVMSVLIVPFALSFISDAFAMEESEDYELFGYSHAYSIHVPIRNGASTFENYTWYLYLSEPTEVIHIDPSGETVVNETLAPGFYTFVYEYTPEERTTFPITWKIGNQIHEYRVTAGYSHEQIIERESNYLINIDEDTTLTVTQSWLTREELKTSLICVVCALIPSLPIISLLKRRSNNGYEPLI